MSTEQLGRLIEILLVEDNPGDAKLAERALKNAKIRNHLHVVENGNDAMAFMRKEGRFADVPRPDVILLDLNLPHKDGREVLAEIKSDDDLKAIPVVVLTSSQAEEDIVKSYELHANCYVTKPLDLERFLEVVKAIKSFWLTIVQLPPNHTH